MTPAEFEEFREEMERVKARASAPPGDPNHPVYETVIRPWQDHYIAVYLSEIGQRQR